LLLVIMYMFMFILIIIQLVFGVLMCFFGFKLFNYKEKHPLLCLALSTMFVLVAAEIVGVHFHFISIVFGIILACICSIAITITISTVKRHFFTMFLYVLMLYFPISTMQYDSIFSLRFSLVLATIAGVITAFNGERIMLIITSAVFGGHFLGILVSLIKITGSYEYMYSLIYSVPFILSGLYVQLRKSSADTEYEIKWDFLKQTRQ